MAKAKQLITLHSNMFLLFPYVDKKLSIGRAPLHSNMFLLFPGHPMP